MAFQKLRALPKQRTKTRSRELKAGNRKLRYPLLKADVMGPEGPFGKMIEIKVTKQKFDLLKKYDFVRIIVDSIDFKLDKELLLKDINTSLCIVPDYIPAILLIMDRGEYEEKVNSLTVFRLNDGKRMRDYLLAHVTSREKESG